MSELADDLAALLGRYQLGQGAFDELVPPLTDELVDALHSGVPLANVIVQRYADALYTATAAAVGAAGPSGSGRHRLLAPAGRITSAEDADQPAVPLLDEHLHRPRFNQYILAEGIHPNIHVAAAAHALATLRSTSEAGGPDELAETLDRAWFLLAFSLNTSLGDGQMLDADRDLIEDLIDCCTRLHEVSGAPEPPPYVRDAADRDLTLRSFVWEWVTSDRYADAYGQTIDEGRPTVWDSGLRFPVGAVLRDRFGGSPVVPAGPAEAIAVGREKAGRGDFAGALRVISSALSDPEYSRQAEDLLRGMTAEHACRELVAILVQEEAAEGSVAHRRVREIGADLYGRGGMQLMRAVHAEFTARRRRISRRLDVLWNGIGDWQG